MSDDEFEEYLFMKEKQSIQDALRELQIDYLEPISNSKKVSEKIMRCLS